MRSYAISSLFLVFVMVSGACAGRQVRTRPIQAPPAADVAAPSASEAVPVPESAVEPASIVEQAEAPAAEPTAIEETPAMTASRMLAEHDAANRAAGEKLHRTHVPASPARNDEIVAALRPAKRLRHKTAPAVEDGGREAVVGSISAAPPALAQVPAAPAASSILPAPQGAETVLTAGPAKDRMTSEGASTALAPDREAVAMSKAYWSNYLIGALVAAGFGLVIGLILSWRQGRRLRAFADTPYDRYPDGTILMQEVVGGVVITKQVIPPVPPEPRSEPVVEQEAKMDSLEQTFLATGEAMDDEDDPQAGTPHNKRFDLTDTEDDVIDDSVFDRTDPQHPPVPFPEPDTIVAPEPSSPHVQPESDDAPRHAAGSGKIISSSGAAASTVSGSTEAPDHPPDTPRSEPEHEGAKVIFLFEDKSSDEQAAPPASAITH